MTMVSEKRIKKVVVVAPGGHKEAFDNRVYICLEANCEGKGSVNEGAFRREGQYTICNGCSGDFNRWHREAAV